MNARRKQVTPTKLTLPIDEQTEIIVNPYQPDMAAFVENVLPNKRRVTKKRSKKPLFTETKKNGSCVMGKKTSILSDSKKLCDDHQLDCSEKAPTNVSVTNINVPASSLNDDNKDPQKDLHETPVKAHFFHKIQSPCLEEESENLNGNLIVDNKVSGKHIARGDECETNKLIQAVKPKTLTDYYPIRRSGRKTKLELQAEFDERIRSAIIAQHDEGLEVKYFPGKGRGVIAKKHFQKGNFVVEYAGDLIDISCAKKREKLYSADQKLGCYMYYFVHKNQHYCVDATKEDGRMGRLVNHSRIKCNLITKTFEVKTKPHLILVASCDIQPGDEILYDYGDRSKQSLIHHPWLAL